MLMFIPHNVMYPKQTIECSAASSIRSNTDREIYVRTQEQVKQYLAVERIQIEKSRSQLPRTRSD